MSAKILINVTIYRDEEYFCGWPFNGGFWQFADGELAVGFIRGTCDYGIARHLKHDVVDNLYGEQLIARSTDGGDTWPEAAITSVYKRPDFDDKAIAAPFADSSSTSYDPSSDGYCLLSGFGMPPKDAPRTQFVMISTDRGHTWSEPVRIRDHDFVTLGGRPSYVLRQDGLLMLFGHAQRPDGIKLPLVHGSTDGGASWGLIGEIEPVPSHPGSIMPYPLILADGRIVVAARRQYSLIQDAYTQIYISDDNGLSWRLLSRVNEWGAPSSLTQLPDGRVVCVYGYRRPPWGIRAKISEDLCATWGEEIILRDDGGSYDLGYPRTLLRPDGALVSVYYFNSKDDVIKQNGGVRHIAGTIWTP